ncbi:MAG: alpha/beta hydrolase [Cryobacterium sp.]
MPHLSVPGAELYFETEGDRAAPALLLIHSGITNLRMWDPQVTSLARRHFVVRFDSRGFGRTISSNTAFSDVADVLALLDHLGVPQATLVGCARGGTIALDVAVTNPERVCGLVLIGAGPSGLPEVELTDAEDTLFDALDAAFVDEDWTRLARLETLLAAVGPLRRAEDLDPDFVAAALELNQVNVVHAAARPIPVPLEPPAVDRVTDLTMPALVAVGEYDITPALAQYEYLLEAVPRASGCTFRNSAHLPSVEHPEEFQRVLVSWLAQNDL